MYMLYISNMYVYITYIYIYIYYIYIENILYFQFI